MDENQVKKATKETTYSTEYFYDTLGKKEILEKSAYTDKYNRIGQLYFWHIESNHDPMLAHEKDYLNEEPFDLRKPGLRITMTAEEYNKAMDRPKCSDLPIAHLADNIDQVLSKMKQAAEKQRNDCLNQKNSTIMNHLNNVEKELSLETIDKQRVLNALYFAKNLIKFS